VHAWGTTAQGVYRAGDTIDYKLYVRDQDNESFVAAPRGPYELAIVDPKGETVQTIPDVTLSAFGGYSGSYAIPESAAVGWYQFKLTSRFGATEPDESDIVRFPLRVLVSDFTPSPFGVRTTLHGDLFEAGDEVNAETHATLFSGRPYADADARVTAQIVPRRSSRSTRWLRRSASTRHAARRAHGVAGHGPSGRAGRIRARIQDRRRRGQPDRVRRAHRRGPVRDDRGKYSRRRRAPTSSRSTGCRLAVHALGVPEDQPARFNISWSTVPARRRPAPMSRSRCSGSRRRLARQGAGTRTSTQFIEDWVDAVTAAAGRNATR